MNYAGGKQKEGVNKGLPERSANAPAGMLALDVEKYRAMLGEEIPEEDARAFIEAMWDIMRTFVDLGWGLDPVQNILALRGEFSSAGSGNSIDSENISLSNELEEAALLAASDEE